MDIEVGVSYNSDLDKVLSVLKGVAQAHPSVMQKPQTDVFLTGFGYSAGNMVLRTWIKDPKGHHNIRSEINCEIVRQFRKNGIEIPFPQQDLHVKSVPPLVSE